MNPSKKEIACVAFFLIFWLVPITYSGLVNRDVPGMPTTLGYLQRISRLFTNTIPSWQVFYLQVRPHNSSTWETLDESDYFRLKPFGYRTRLHQILIHTKDEKGFPEGQAKTSAREHELIRWVAGRYHKHNPDKPRIAQARIVCAFHNIQDGKDVKGRWVKPPLEYYPASQTIVVATHRIED